MDLTIAFLKISAGVLALPATAMCLAGSAVTMVNLLNAIAETLAVAWLAEVFWVDGARR